MTDPIASPSRDTAGDDLARARIARYLDGGLARVPGWFEEEDPELLGAVLEAQLDMGLLGDVAEIGVHFGKSFLLLANGTRDGERAVALDVFGDQEKNVDKSGYGDRERFEANVAAHAAEADVHIVQASSLEIAPERAAETFGRVRMFSIDGGHTSAITAHDLRLAEACVVDDGVVVVDDILNPHWTGVVTGVADYLAGPHRLVPFAVSTKKLLFATSDGAAREWATRLRTAKPEVLGKEGVEFFGHSLDAYGVGSERRRDRARAERDAATAQAEQLDALRERVRRQRDRLQHLRRRLREIETSTSWRVTEPLRRIAGRVR